MSKYRICEYTNGLGKKQYKAQYKWLWFWMTYQSYCSPSGAGIDMRFNTKKEAKAWLNKVINGKFIKTNCFECEG